MTRGVFRLFSSLQLCCNLAMITALKTRSQTDFSNIIVFFLISLMSGNSAPALDKEHLLQFIFLSFHLFFVILVIEPRAPALGYIGSPFFS